MNFGGKRLAPCFVVTEAGDLDLLFYFADDPGGCKCYHKINDRYDEVGFEDPAVSACDELSLGQKVGCAYYIAMEVHFKRYMNSLYPEVASGARLDGDIVIAKRDR